MTELFQIVGVAILTVLLALVIKQERPEFALLLSLTVGTIFLFIIFQKVQLVFDVIVELADKAGIGRVYLGTLLKIIGIAYVTEFGVQLCRDAGETAIASKLEAMGKIIVMVIAVPIFVLVIETLNQLVP